MSILTSSSLQFFLIRLFFIILNYLYFLLLYPILNDFLNVLQRQLVYRADLQLVAVFYRVPANPSRPDVPYHLRELPQPVPSLEEFVDFQGTDGLVVFGYFVGGLFVLEEVGDFLLVVGIVVRREHIHYMEFKL